MDCKRGFQLELVGQSASHVTISSKSNKRFGWSNILSVMCGKEEIKGDGQDCHAVKEELINTHLETAGTETNDRQRVTIHWGN